MSNWLGRLLGRRTAAEDRRRNPALESAIAQSALIFARIPLVELIDETRRAALARELYLEVNSMCNGKSELAERRDPFAVAMLTLAAYQVLVIPAAPQLDESGLRNEPGISGELHPHLAALCRKDDTLRSALSDVAKTGDAIALETALQRLYWESYWRLETLNAARVALGDCTPPHDWDKAFLHAACVTAEHHYRWALEIAPALREDGAKEAADAYSVFTDIVLSGAIDPSVEWRNYYRDADIPMPSFGKAP